jgi:predicted HAD superfamily Cof-like phosphohydrolase
LSNQERTRLIRSRIRRAHSALDRAADLIAAKSHVETVESALVDAIAETTEAEKLMRLVVQQ